MYHIARPTNVSLSRTYIDTHLKLVSVAQVQQNIIAVKFCFMQPPRATLGIDSAIEIEESEKRFGELLEIQLRIRIISSSYILFP